MRRTEGCAKLFRTFYQRLRASKSISKQKWFFHLKNIEQQCIQLKVWNLKLIHRGCFRRVIACTKSNDVCIYYLERLDSYLFHFYIFWWLERNRIAILKALCDLIIDYGITQTCKTFYFWGRFLYPATTWKLWTTIQWPKERPYLTKAHIASDAC